MRRALSGNSGRKKRARRGQLVQQHNNAFIEGAGIPDFGINSPGQVES